MAAERPALEQFLEGKRALVTASSRNLGASIARELATLGASVCIQYHASKEAAIRLIESGRVPLEKMHTHDFPLEEAERAIRTLAGDVPGESSLHSCLLPGR